jgi:hypothetical protein
MFHFPRFPLPVLCVQTGMARHDPYQVVLFGNPRIDACLAAPRGLSQPATSFIGFQRLGIHRVPFYTCRDDARARYRVLKVQRHRPPPAPTRTRHPSRGTTGTRTVHQMSAAAPATAESSLEDARSSATFKAAQCAQHTTVNRIELVITTRGGPPSRAVTLRS